ncbi:hypothetical protein HUW63_14140 [Myxococcus sp. AM001]|nr:hypothetical protein [Myxococcus sp. AM001]
MHYAVAVSAQTGVRLLDAKGRPRKYAQSVSDLAWQIHERGGFRRSTWRQGTQDALSARFALRRVVAAGVPQREQEPMGLLIEWRDGELDPANYFLISLPEGWTKRQLIRLVMQRWRTERVYEDLKGELGLDHYEGRRFPGWHHHVSVALCCYAFLVAERTRRFPPRPEGRLTPTRSHSLPERHFHDSFITARLAMARVIATWLPRCPTCHRANHQRAARRLPGLPVHPSGP